MESEDIVWKLLRDSYMLTLSEEEIDQPLHYCFLILKVCDQTILSSPCQGIFSLTVRLTHCLVQFFFFSCSGGQFIVFLALGLRLGFGVCKPMLECFPWPWPVRRILVHCCLNTVRRVYRDRFLADGHSASSFLKLFSLLHRKILYSNLALAIMMNVWQTCISSHLWSGSPFLLYYLRFVFCFLFLQIHCWFKITCGIINDNCCHNRWGPNSVGNMGRVLEEVFLDCYFTWSRPYGRLKAGCIT